MVLMAKSFKASFKMFRWIPGFSLVVAMAVFSTGCAKKPAGDQPPDKSTSAGNGNQKDQSETGAPYTQQTLKGDIERVSLAISMAHDSARSNKWQEAASQLRGAKNEIDTALNRKPRLREELESLKAAIDRALPAVETGSKEAEARLTELQTRIGAIKVNSFQQ